MAPGEAIKAALKQSKSWYPRHCRGLTQLAIWALFSLDSAFGDKALQACPPAAMGYVESLDLSGFKSLTALPENMHVAGRLNLSGCSSLRSLPRGLHVYENLDLSYCSALESLPDGLMVRIHLDLQGCTALRTIGAGLSVGQGCRVSFKDCERWDGNIPPDAVLPGADRSILDNLRPFIRLPEIWKWILQLICPVVLCFALPGWCRIAALLFWGVSFSYPRRSTSDLKAQQFHTFLMSQLILLYGVMLGSAIVALTGCAPGNIPFLLVPVSWTMYLVHFGLDGLSNLFTRTRKARA
jgi:hypothetical protein